MKKAQALKDEWIKEMQHFQTLSRGGEDPDSYEELSARYDEEHKPK